MFARSVRATLALLGFLALTGAAMADVTFTGEVTYRERMALPANAELWITLVSVADGKTVVSAAAPVAPSGQVPLQFTLNVRSDIIDDGRRYGLVAEIRVGGGTLFRNTEPVPVDPLAPAPTMILVNFSPAPPHDASEAVLPPAETVNPLLETIWMVTSIGGDPVLPETEVTFSIAADHRAGGNGGCNNYFTEASFDNGAPLSFGPVAGTRMACAPEVMAQESAFFNALDAIVGYELSGSELSLVDTAGVPLVGMIQVP